MRILLAFKNRLRKDIPYLFATLGMFVTAFILVSASDDYNIDLCLITGAIIGYIIGIVVRRYIPNPEDKAL